jgi:hypothetical protein
VAFVTVRRDQRDEQLFWLALLRAIRESVDERDTDEPLIATPGFNAEAMAWAYPTLVDIPDESG